MSQVEWIHRTNKGRVIYDRKPHTFSAADVNRVHRGWLDQATFPELWDILTAVSFSTADRAQLLEGSRSAYRALWGFIDTLISWFQGMFDPFDELLAQQIYEIALEIKTWIEAFATFYHWTWIRRS